MNRHMLILGSLFLTACGSGPATARLESALPPHSGEILASAAQDIETASGNAFMHDEDSDFTIHLKYGPLATGILGQAQVADDEDCYIVILDKMNPALGIFSEADLRHVLMHEIGHCFGLEHDPDEHQIMFWEYLPGQDTSVGFSHFIQNINRARGAK